MDFFFVLDFIFVVNVWEKICIPEEVWYLNQSDMVTYCVSFCNRDVPSHTAEAFRIR